jgi:alpha-D-xyloside xylohydrolase
MKIDSLSRREPNLGKGYRMNAGRRWRRVIIIAAILGGCAIHGAITAAPIPVTSVTKDATGVTFAMSPGSMRIDVCTDGIIRVRYSQQNTVPVDNNMSFLVTKTWPAVSFTQTETTSDVSIVTPKVQVKVDKSTGALTFLDAGGTTVLQETTTGGKSLTPATINGESTNTCEQIFDSPADEGIYGLGSFHDGIINYHGIPQYLYQTNTHISIPMIVSSKGYGILWANASRTYFNQPGQRITGGQYTTTAAGDYVFLAVDGPLQQDLSITVDGKLVNRLSNTWHSGSVAGKVNLTANKSVSVSVVGSGASCYGGPLKNETKFTSRAGQTIDYYFFYGPSPDEAIAGYRLATGAASLFSKGIYGFIQCRERYSSQTEILDNASQFRSKKIPVDVIVQDWNYWGSNGWGSMMFDQAAYPNPTQMIQTLHQQNFKYMISVWSNPQGGAVNNALTSQNLKIPGSPFYDAFNPTARSVYWSYMKTNLFDIGTDAFWQDADEPEGLNLENCKVNFGSGQVGGKTYANAYPMFVCKTVYDGCRSANPAKRVCVKSRSAFAGTQRLGSFCWNGDIGGNWDWYQRSVRAGLNFCMAGMPYWTTDIGGFFRPGSGQFTDAGYNELLTRWIQYGAFCPMFRIHGYQTNTEIWRYTTATLNAFMIYDNLRYRLLPYIYSLAGMVTLNGYTMMRGLVMDFWTDEKVLNVADQFMFGPAILVNPIMSAGATSRNVYLPSGATWFNFWTGQTTAAGGQSTSARAPRDTIPLFVRAGSIIPMGPYLQYATEKKADTIELRVYPGANGSFTMYEDEGDNYNYETGKYSTIPITYVDNPKTVNFGQRTGSFTGMDQKKVFNIVYVSSNHGTGVGITTSPDQQIVYDGTPVVGVLPARFSAAAMLPPDCTVRSTGCKIALPRAFSGKTKAITVYDCSGRLLQKAVVKKNMIDVRKDLGLPAGVYIVKARAIR